MFLLGGFGIGASVGGGDEDAGRPEGGDALQVGVSAQAVEADGAGCTHHLPVEIVAQDHPLDAHSGKDRPNHPWFEGGSGDVAIEGIEQVGGLRGALGKR